MVDTRAGVQELGALDRTGSKLKISPCFWLCSAAPTSPTTVTAVRSGRITASAPTSCLPVGGEVIQLMPSPHSD